MMAMSILLSLGFALPVTAVSVTPEIDGYTAQRYGNPFNIHPIATPSEWTALKIDIASGEIVSEAFVGPSLGQTKAAQILVLNSAFQAAIIAPVSYKTAAGATADFPQSARTYLAQYISDGPESWTINLWLNADNAPVTPFTFADLRGLSAAFDAQQTPDHRDLLSKIAAVDTATTADAVLSNSKSDCDAEQFRRRK